MLLYISKSFEKKLLSILIIFSAGVSFSNAQKSQPFDVLQNKTLLIQYNSEKVVILPRGHVDTYVEERTKKVKNNRILFFSAQESGHSSLNWKDPILHGHFRKINQRALKDGTMAQYVATTIPNSQNLATRVFELLRSKGNQIHLLEKTINPKLQANSTMKVGKLAIPTRSYDYEPRVMSMTWKVRKSLKKKYGIIAEPSIYDFIGYFEDQKTKGLDSIPDSDFLVELDIVPMIEANYKTAILGVTEYKPQNQPQIFLRVEMKVHDVKNNLTLFENTDIYSFTTLKSDQSKFIDNYKEINKNFKNLKWKYNDQFYPLLDQAMEGLYNVYMAELE